MKNKKSIYILLPLVLLIWVLVIYEFFSFSSPEIKLGETPDEYVIKPFQLKERDTFSINVAYRDPFLGRAYTTQTTNAKQKKVKQEVSTKPVEVAAIVWPTILYKGIVSDTKEEKKVFMLVISGHVFFMKKGDTENEVFLKDGDKNSIHVSYKGNTNIIMLAG